MRDFVEAIVLGLLQGLTEFLPISSSAHLRIIPEFLGWGDPGAATVRSPTSRSDTPSSWAWRRRWH